MKYYVRYKIDARYTAEVEAESLEEAKELADSEFSEADFGGGRGYRRGYCLCRRLRWQPAYGIERGAHMADYYLATIDILKEHIERDPDVKKMVQDYFYSPDGKLYDEDNWEENSPIAHFRDEKARNGFFEELEFLLRMKKIPYDRWSDAYDEDSVQVYYRPDIPDSPVYVDGSNKEREYTESFLRALTDGLDDYSDIGKKFKEFLDSIPEIKPLESYLAKKKKLTVRHIYNDNDDGLAWAYVVDGGRFCYVATDYRELPKGFYNNKASVKYNLLGEYLANKGLDITKKPHIEDATPAMQYLWKNITDSENCMWFVEDDAPWEWLGISKKEFERQIDADVFSYGLENVIAKNKDDSLYVCYENLQSAFTGKEGDDNAR